MIYFLIKTSPKTNKGPLGWGTSKAIKAGAQFVELSLIIYSEGFNSNITPLRFIFKDGKFDKSEQLTFNLDRIVLMSLI